MFQWSFTWVEQKKKTKTNRSVPDRAQINGKWYRTDQEMLHVTKRVGNGKSQNNFEQKNSKKLWVARVLKLSWKYSFSLPLKRKETWW